MKIAAVICEYNPFHNGHKYMLDTIRKETGCDAIICLMSGDYVQRGEPSIYSKEMRAKLALENGASLVLELPLPYATSASDLFAYGAVSILNKLSNIEYLCFGAKCDDISLLQKINLECMEKANINKEEMQNLIKQGMTYAKARSVLMPEYKEIFEDSNNVLALDYLRALNELKSPIKPFLIKRVGQDYDDDTLDKDFEYLSASAIRNALKTNIPVNEFVPFNIEETKEKAVFTDDLSQMLFFALNMHKENLSDYLDVSEDLAQRIVNHLYEYESINQFTNVIKAKNYTHVRIKRALLHILLNIKHDNEYYKNNVAYINHVRILGIKSNQKDIMKLIANSENIKLINNPGSAGSSFNAFEEELESISLKASTIRNYLQGNMISEYSKKLTVL